MVFDIELVARAGGLKILLNTLVDGPHELSQILTTVFLHVLDSPSSRKYLTPGRDLEVSLSASENACAIHRWAFRYSYRG